MRGIRDLKKAEGSTSTKDAPTWSRRQGILFATGLPIMIIALALATYFLFLRSKIDTSRPEDQTRARDEAKIDAMSSEEVWTSWQSIRDAQLQRFEAPEYIQNRDEARKFLILAIASVGVAGLGLGAMVAAFFVKPSPVRKSDAL
jgi:hypothetical protein